MSLLCSEVAVLASLDGGGDVARARRLDGGDNAFAASRAAGAGRRRAAGGVRFDDGRLDEEPSRGVDRRDGVAERGMALRPPKLRKTK